MTTEKELIKKVKQKDAKAFQELVEKHKSMVFNTCMGFVHNKENAEDITQDIFVKIWLSIDKYKGEAKFSTWLYRITVNYSLNFIRKNKKSKLFASIDSSETPEIKNISEDDAEKLILRQESAKKLKNALNSIAKRQRVAFILNKYENLSYKEISEIMEISLSSVESLIHRAKINLQKKLK